MTHSDIDGVNDAYENYFDSRQWFHGCIKVSVFCHIAHVFSPNISRTATEFDPLKDGTFWNNVDAILLLLLFESLVSVTAVRTSRSH